MPANFATIEATEFKTHQAAVQATDFAPDSRTLRSTIYATHPTAKFSAL
jgi:hypothetical protein